MLADLLGHVVDDSTLNGEHQVQALLVCEVQVLRDGETDYIRDENETFSKIKISANMKEMTKLKFLTRPNIHIQYTSTQPSQSY